MMDKIKGNKLNKKKLLYQRMKVHNKIQIKMTINLSEILPNRFH